MYARVFIADFEHVSLTLEYRGGLITTLGNM